MKGNWISNEDLYTKPKVEPWPRTISRRRLRFFGHIARLDDKTPAKLALYEAMRDIKHPRGRQKTTLLGSIKKQLQDLCNLDLYEAINIAQDRVEWRTRVVSKL